MPKTQVPSFDYQTRSTQELLKSDRVPPGRVKILRKKWTPALTWLYLKNKKNVMGPTANIIARIANAVQVTIFVY